MSTSPTRDDATTITGDIASIANAVWRCSQAWEPDVRLIGNVRAADIGALARFALGALAAPAAPASALTIEHAKSIEYVLAMLDQIAPRAGGADNRAHAREAATIIRAMVTAPASAQGETEAERAWNASAIKGESMWEQMTPAFRQRLEAFAAALRTAPPPAPATAAKVHDFDAPITLTRGSVALTRVQAEAATGDARAGEDAASVRLLTGYIARATDGALGLPYIAPGGTTQWTTGADLRAALANVLMRLARAEQAAREANAQRDAAWNEVLGATLAGEYVVNERLNAEAERDVFKRERDEARAALAHISSAARDLVAAYDRDVELRRMARPIDHFVASLELHVDAYGPDAHVAIATRATTDTP